jgi:hypothetical protein
VTSRPMQEEGTVSYIDDYRKPEPRRRLLPLLAYCLAVGCLGTAIATVVSFAVPDSARLPVWSAVVGSVSLLAGFTYDSLARLVTAQLRG